MYQLSSPYTRRQAACVLLLVIAVIASSAGCTNTQGLSSSDSFAEEKSEVEAELLQYYKDFSDRDWEAFADHFWPEAVMATIWPAEGADTLVVDIFTIPEFVKKAPEGPGSQPIFEEVMTSVEITVSGTLAQAWAGYDAKFGTEDNLMEWSGTDAFTLLKYDGRWRIVSIAYASD